MADRKFNIIIDGKNKFGRTAKFVGRELKSLGRIARRVGRGIRATFGAARKVIGSMLKTVVAGTAALVGVSALAVRAFIKQQDAEMNLAAALRNHGDAVDKLLPKYKKFASGLQQVTKYGDEDILTQMAFARNLGVTADKLEDATTAAVGLAAKYRIDLATSMMLIGRASMGQTQMLTRYGIILDETLTVQEKFNALLKIGASALGLAEDEAKTLGGRLQQSKMAFGDMMEAIGGAIAQSFSLAETFDKVKLAIVKLTESGKIEEWVGRLKDSLAALKPIMQPILDISKGLLKGGAARETAVQGMKIIGKALGDKALAVLMAGGRELGFLIAKGFKVGIGFGASAAGRRQAAAEALIEEEAGGREGLGLAGRLKYNVGYWGGGETGRRISERSEEMARLNLRARGQETLAGIESEGIIDGLKKVAKAVNRVDEHLNLE